MHDDLAADRKEADDALDEKFDHSGSRNDDENVRP